MQLLRQGRRSRPRDDDRAAALADRRSSLSPGPCPCASTAASRSFIAGSPRRWSGRSCTACERSLSTNGILIPRRERALRATDVVKVSIDGPPEVHDSARGVGLLREGRYGSSAGTGARRYGRDSHDDGASQRGSARARDRARAKARRPGALSTRHRELARLERAPRRTIAGRGGVPRRDARPPREEDAR